MITPYRQPTFTVPCCRRQWRRHARGTGFVAAAGTRPSFALLSSRLASLRRLTQRRARLRLSDLQYLMQRLGPATPEIVTIVQDAIDRWTLEFDDGMSMQVAWDEQTTHVLMKCALGRSDGSARESTADLLAGENGMALALRDSGEGLVLTGECDIGAASVGGLSQCVSEFLACAEKIARRAANASGGTCSQEGR